MKTNANTRIRLEARFRLCGAFLQNFAWLDRLSKPTPHNVHGHRRNQARRLSSNSGEIWPGFDAPFPYGKIPGQNWTRGLSNGAAFFAFPDALAFCPESDKGHSTGSPCRSARPIPGDSIPNDQAGRECRPEQGVGYSKALYNFNTYLAE
jgi:hypothetical protein